MAKLTRAQFQTELNNRIPDNNTRQITPADHRSVEQDLADSVIWHGELGTAADEDAQESPTDATVGRLLAVGAFGLGAPLQSINGSLATSGFAYAKVASITRDRSLTLFVAGSGDYGSNTRDNGILNMASRSGVHVEYITITQSSAGSKARFHTVDNGEGAFDLWVQKAGYQADLTLTVLNARSGVLIEPDLVWLDNLPPNAVLAETKKSYHTGNTTVDSNGFIKVASPILQVFSDRVDGAEDQGIAFSRVFQGVYTLSGSSGLAEAGWRVEAPQDDNGNRLVHVSLEEDDGTITLTTSEPDWQDGRMVAGDRKDIPEGRFVNIRLKDISEE